MLTDSAEVEDAVELRTVDENKLVLTIRMASSSESAVGWVRLGVVASRQMQAKLGPDVTIEDPDYRLSRSLYRLELALSGLGSILKLTRVKMIFRKMPGLAHRASRRETEER